MSSFIRYINFQNIFKFAEQYLKNAKILLEIWRIFLKKNFEKIKKEKI